MRPNLTGRKTESSRIHTPAGSWACWLMVAETAAAPELGRGIPSDMQREEVESVKTSACGYQGMEGEKMLQPVWVSVVCVCVFVSVHICACAYVHMHVYMCLYVHREEMKASGVKMAFRAVLHCKVICRIREKCEGGRENLGEGHCPHLYIHLLTWNSWLGFVNDPSSSVKVCSFLSA